MTHPQTDLEKPGQVCFGCVRWHSKKFRAKDGITIFDNLTLWQIDIVECACTFTCKSSIRYYISEAVDKRCNLSMTSVHHPACSARQAYTMQPLHCHFQLMTVLWSHRRTCDHHLTQCNLQLCKPIQNELCASKPYMVMQELKHLTAVSFQRGTEVHVCACPRVWSWQAWSHARLTQRCVVWVVAMSPTNWWGHHATQFWIICGWYNP